MAVMTMFYKTENGAHVADVYMSLIYTCELCRANPFDYLMELQRHAPEVAANPACWMPWNYRDTLAVAPSTTGPPAESGPFLSPSPLPSLAPSLVEAKCCNLRSIFPRTVVLPSAATIARHSRPPAVTIFRPAHLCRKITAAWTSISAPRCPAR